LGAVVIALPTPVAAADSATRVGVSARVDPAPCTPAQRRISRSCAPVEETLQMQPLAFAVAGDRSNAPTGMPAYVVVVDPAQQTMVRTLRY
jgi:hypothetical protein